MNIVGRYILREILTPFLLGLGVFTLILLIARVLKLIEMVVNRGVPLIDVVRLFSYILPAFLEVTVPMAVLLAVVVAFGRLSSDSELVALRASGISLYQLAIPVALFAVAIWAIASIISLHGRPWGNSRLRSALYEMAKTRATVGIKERVFTDDFEGLVIYVDQIEPPGDVLRGVLISDSRDPNQRNTILAKIGSLVPNESTHVLSLRLVDGTIHAFAQQDRSYHRTDFATFDVVLDLGGTLAMLQPRERDPSELTIPELQVAALAKRSMGQAATPELIELHRKFSIPFASLIFAVIGVPLGARPSRAVRSRGFAVSIALVFVYYLILTLGESLGQRELLAPGLALWLPNALFAPFAVLLFQRAAREGARTNRSGFGATLLRVYYRFLPSAG